MNIQDTGLINNEAVHNFEVFIDGHRSFIDYKIKGDKIYLIHTEVPGELQGQGVAEVLVEKALKYIAGRNLKPVPVCTYIQAFLKHHPEWDRLLAG